MKKAAIKTALFTVIILVICSIPSLAKHLVGGSVTYQYLGIVSGYNKYRITADIFRDCLDKAAPQLDDSITMGFYEATGSSTMPLDYKLLMQRVSLESVLPVSGSHCSFKPNTCLQHGIYTGDIYLPSSIYGFYMEYQRCCRNTIDNIYDNSGYNFWGFISPTKYKNTSPSFNDVPVPYVCVDDTVTLNFSASEPDGDVIKYDLATPYSGASGNNPSPGPPSYYMIPDNYQVQYKFGGGFSATTPFGTGGSCSIDHNSGLLKVFAPMIGRFAIAVDYIEYRNGIEINRTRRDVQFITVSCPSNPVPVRQAVNGATPGSYYVQGGEAFNFNLNYADPVKDSVFLSVSGNIMNRKTNPAKFITIKPSSPTDAIGTVTWQTTCNDISASPYQLLVKAQDNGCPSKILLQTINLYVQPPVTPVHIDGPKVACGTRDTFTYSAGSLLNYTLVWAVTGGKIISSNKGNSIRVIWNASPAGIIKMVAMNVNGCSGDTVVMKVKIIANPVVSSLSGPAKVCINKSATYSISGAANTAAFWDYGSAKVIVINARFITVSWPDSGVKTIAVLVRDTNGCMTDTLKYKTQVTRPVLHEIYGPNSVCPNSRGIDYYCNYQQGSVYTWTITGGVQADGGNSSHITVNWGNLGKGTIKVTETTSENCKSDTVDLDVSIDYILVSPAIQGDSFTCENRLRVYKVLNIHNSSFQWSVAGGMIVSGQGTYTITVNWGKPGNGMLKVQQTAYDSINNAACIAAPVFMRVYINVTPNTSAIAGDSLVCLNTLHSYLVHGIKTSSFIWKINDSILPVNNTGHDSLSIFFTKPGIYLLTVTEMSRDSCPGIMQAKKIIVDSIPDTGPIIGPASVCAPDFTNIPYAVKGRVNSTYNWHIDGGTIISGQGTSGIIVNWNRLGMGKLIVLETSAIGCSGPERILDVKIDSLVLIMDLVTTSRDNDKQVEVHWHLMNSQFLNYDINILRSVDPFHEGFRKIASVPDKENVYTDKTVSTHTQAYYYKIETVNSCGNLVSSATHRTILLLNEPLQDSTLAIKWNNYMGWPDGVSQYSIYKSSNNDPSLNRYNFSQDTNAITFTDLIGYRQCFRIAAPEKNEPGIISWSNNICVDLNPILWIPDVYTPNGDKRNETWRVVVSNYKSFKADIYNRWGEHIFSSDNPELQWDGTFKGNLCPEGVYLYMINVGGVRDNIYRNGTVNLLR